MTTAHRPTFDPARGKEALRGPAYHQRLLPAHTQLKRRQVGQGGAADSYDQDLRADLLAAEAEHFAQTGRGPKPDTTTSQSAKRELEAPKDDANEDSQAKRRRILEETRDIDADSDSDKSKTSNDDSEDDDDQSDDEEEQLMRELEKIKRERADQKAKEEAEKAAEAQEQREESIALGNPLLNPKSFNVKRRWDDDVVFKNQARGTEQKGNKEFVNDLLRSDFHKKFMSKYVR